ncbi:MAG: DEAD/DEAH box helicase [Acidilobaceae archaeon]
MDNASMLHPRIRDILLKLGYTRLFPIQEKAIPPILSGYNTIIVAPTGSGKTEAALIPVLSLMLSERDKGTLGNYIKLIYITPLRALNRDIAYRISKLCESLGFRVLVRHGDTGPSIRRKFLREPPDVMVTTPESLNLLLTLRDYIDIWGNVGWVIVDEVHELLDSERGAELTVILERLQRISRRRIQRIGLSATLSRKSLTEALNLLSYGRYVSIVEDSQIKSYDISVDVVDYTNEDRVWDKAIKRIAEIINNTPGSILVFTNTRSTAELLASSLSIIIGESSVGVHHGSLSRDIRESIERDFREGRIKALVATSSMELGIDIGRVNLVMQFLSPKQVIAMTQRAGRAGHRLGETSRAVIVTINNIFEILESGVIAFRTLKGDLEDIKAHRTSYDAMAHQIVAMIVGGIARNIDDIHRILTSTYTFSDISIDDVRGVVNHLASVKVLNVDSNGNIGESRRSRKYLYSVSMIPDERTLEVINIVDESKIGEVSEVFIETILLQSKDSNMLKSKGVSSDRFKFVLAGRIWEALDIDLDSERVTVKPIAEVEGVIPSWEGELIPVSYKVAREVCSLMSLLMQDPSKSSKILEPRRLKAYESRIIDVLENTRKLWGVTPTYSSPVIEEVNNLSVLHVCLGSKGNFTLALVLSKLMEKYKPVEFEYIPYAIVFKSTTGVSGEFIAKALEEAKSLDKGIILSLIYDSLRSTKAYMIRFYHVAKRMGVIDPEADVRQGLIQKLIEAYNNSVVEREAIREMIYDKLDFEALEEFLRNLDKPVVVSLNNPSPLTLEVLRNPYIRRDTAANIKMLALDYIIEAKKKHIEAKESLLLCIKCGNTFKRRVSDIKGRVKCTKCNELTLAPLPDTEWGRNTVEIYRKYLRNEKLQSEEKKIVEEVMDRAGLYMSYAAYDLGGYVVKALMAHGVGPKRARRVMEAYIRGKERAFWEELIKAEEEYVTTRRFWS